MTTKAGQPVTESHTLVAKAGSPRVASTADGGGYRARLARNVVRYSSADWEGLLAFRRAIGAAESLRSDREFFRWQFDENPGTAGDGAAVWLYK